MATNRQSVLKSYSEGVSGLVVRKAMLSGEREGGLEGKRQKKPGLQVSPDTKKSMVHFIHSGSSSAAAASPSKGTTQGETSDCPQ